MSATKSISQEGNCFSSYYPSITKNSSEIIAQPPQSYDRQSYCTDNINKNIYISGAFTYTIINTTVPVYNIAGKNAGCLDGNNITGYVQYPASGNVLIDNINSFIYHLITI